MHDVHERLCSAMAIIRHLNVIYGKYDLFFFFFVFFLNINSLVWTESTDKVSSYPVNNTWGMTTVFRVNFTSEF